MSQFQILDTEAESKNAVLSFGSLVYKLSTFLNIATQACRNSASHQINTGLAFNRELPFGQEAYSIFDDGVEVELMKPNGNGWHQGKVRLRLIVEFCPDEPEASPETEETPASEQLEVKPPDSPLDDIRRIIYQDSEA